MEAFHKLTLQQLVDAIRFREISAVEALEAHLGRIAEVNPAINAVVTLDEDGAYRRAHEADIQIAEAGKSQKELPALIGVPMTHKDNIATKGIRTTLGSPIFRDNVPAQNALIIERLQVAGVNSTGKTNVPEFAAGSHTFNPLFGTTRNPYDVNRSSGGSSGGVAAAVASGIQPAGDGSDTGGSLRTPGSFCNVIGYRPSLGRIPMAPARNPWAWMARQGFLARTIEDIRLLMRSVVGEAAGSPNSLPADSSYDTPARKDLKGLRIGWTEDFGLTLPVEKEVLEALRPAISTFEKLGAWVAPACPDLTDADEVFQTTRAFDFATQFGHLMEDHRYEMKAAMAWNVDKGLSLTLSELISANDARARLLGKVNRFFADYDLLIAPSVQVLPFDANIEFPTEVAGVPTPNYLDWMRASTLISATGLPCLSVPAAFTADGLPVGLQIVAPERHDSLLLDVAELFESSEQIAARRPVLRL